MKKHSIRIVAIIMAAIMAAAALAGCKNDGATPGGNIHGGNSEIDRGEQGGNSGNGTIDAYETQEYIYKAQSIPLPDDIGELTGLVFSDGTAYISTATYDTGNEENFYSHSATPCMYSVNLDGTGFAPLAGYTPKAAASGNTHGDVNIQKLSVDAIGNLWIVERWDLYAFELPTDFNRETGNPWGYMVSRGSGSAVRKLDSTGSELLSVDVSGFSNRESVYINSMIVDNSGYVYLSTDNWEQGGMTVYVLDNDGKLVFHIDVDDWFDNFTQTSDGIVAFINDSTDNGGGSNRKLQTIDVAAKALGEVIQLPISTDGEISPGSGDSGVLINNYNSLYSYTEGDDEAVKLLGWLESDVIYGNVQNIMLLPDERIICTNQRQNRATYEPIFELLVLSKVPNTELLNKTVLTLASFGTRDIGEAVVQFNRTNPDYRIHVTDYSEFNTGEDRSAGLTRLTTEFISGTVPDIIDVADIPYREYATKGLFADLYLFIDADPEYSRSDFVQGAFRAAEIDGKLYQVFPSLCINTLIGNPAVVGAGTGWNMEEFRSVIDEHPEADMPIGTQLYNMSFLQAAVSFSIDEYIDWKTGTAHFDDGNFAQLLELAGTFPKGMDISALELGIVPEFDDSISPEQAIMTGRQIMTDLKLTDFYTYQWNKALFGGDIAFKGFPAKSRNGNSLSVQSGLAIIEMSPNKEGAWAFVRTVLDKDWQLSSSSWSMLTNRAAFDYRAQEAMAQEYDDKNYGIGMTETGVVRHQVKTLTQADIAQIVALIDSISGTADWNIDQAIWNIISESASDFFDGTATAQDAARVIQSRMSILVSERS